MNKPEYINNAVNYALKRLGKTNRLYMLRFLYLADKCHLARAGRTITGDKYYNTDCGVIGLLSRDMLNVPYASANSPIEYKGGKMGYYLSDSDYQALDIIINNYHRLSLDGLTEIARQYPEYNKGSGERVSDEELLSLTDNDYSIFGVTPGHVELSREILLGQYD